MNSISRTPAAAIKMNGARQSKAWISSAPADGAITGAAVNNMVISDINLAASLPLEMSRMMARDSTIAEAAAKPCTKRAARMTSMLFARATTSPLSVNSNMPAYSTGSRPRRSLSRPAGIWPKAMPAMKMPMIFCVLETSDSSASAIAGTAGRLRSTVSAARAVSRPSVRIKRLDWGMSGGPASG